jgi:hypothetical protein
MLCFLNAVAKLVVQRIRYWLIRMINPCINPFD